MPYDAGMLAAVAYEIGGMAGARCEKIYCLGSDEIIILLRGKGENKRIYINVGSSSPRLCFTDENIENPDTPPNFCMIMRKHLNGSLFQGITQLGAERVVRLDFAARDEMGFECTRSLYVEIMNKYSNAILCRDDDKIIGAAKNVDFSTSRLRQILPGMKYTTPPPQDKTDILSVDMDTLFRDAAAAIDMPADKFLIKTYTGFSPLLSRELAYRAGGKSDALLSECDGSRLWEAFSYVETVLRAGEPVNPTMIADESGNPKEFSFTDILEYGNTYKKTHFASPSELICAYFRERGRAERATQRGHDIVRLITNAKKRIEKKLVLLSEELIRADEGEEYKRTGDIINSNLFLLKRGMKEAELTDYYSDDCKTVKVKLNERLSPSDNAQYYYRQYAKCKTSKVMTSEQIALAKAELAYIESVEDAFSRAGQETELDEIRRELASAGYGKAVRSPAGKKPKKVSNSYEKYITTNGYTVLCGKNNLGNDELTHHVAEAHDWWFHVKGAAGSHTVMFCEPGEDPPEEDFTDACMIAAVNSSQSSGVMVAVDYTNIKNIKKPSGSVPGFVTYKTNWSAYVTPDREHVAEMKKKAQENGRKERM